MLLFYTHAYQGLLIKVEGLERKKKDLFKNDKNERVKLESLIKVVSNFKPTGH